MKIVAIDGTGLKRTGISHIRDSTDGTRCSPAPSTPTRSQALMRDEKVRQVATSHSNESQDVVSEGLASSP
jgi:hypothetical protein